MKIDKYMENNYLYGLRPVAEALSSGKKIEKVFFKQGLEGETFRALLSDLEAAGVTVQFVPGVKLDKLCGGGKGPARHQGVVAYLAPIDYVPLEEMVERALARSEAPVFVMLDGVSDVRNLGAIARSAECAGASGVILPAKGGAAINAEGIKASAGALLRIDTCKCQNLRLPIMFLKDKGFRIVAASEKSSKLMYDVDLKGPVAIVMGFEGRGISDSVLALCDERARIPMAGEIGSLNVSIAAALMMFEALRQRQ